MHQQKRSYRHGKQQVSNILEKRRQKKQAPREGPQTQESGFKKSPSLAHLWPKHKYWDSTHIYLTFVSQRAPTVHTEYISIVSSWVDEDHSRQYSLNLTCRSTRERSAGVCDEDIPLLWTCWGFCRDYPGSDSNNLQPFRTGLNCGILCRFLSAIFDGDWSMGFCDLFLDSD